MFDNVVQLGHFGRIETLRQAKLAQPAIGAGDPQWRDIRTVFLSLHKRPLGCQIALRIVAEVHGPQKSGISPEDVDLDQSFVYG